MQIRKDKDGSWDVEITDAELEEMPDDLYIEFCENFKEYKPGIFAGEDAEVVKKLKAWDDERKEKPKPKKRVRKKKERSVAGDIIKELHKVTGIPKAMVARDLHMVRTDYLAKLRREMRFDTFLKIVDDLGYRVEILPGDSPEVKVGGKAVRWRNDDEVER